MAPATAPHAECPMTSTTFAPASFVVNSLLPRMSGCSMLPATRALKMSPMPRLKRLSARRSKPGLTILKVWACNSCTRYGEGFSLPDHPQNPPPPHCRRQVFQRVSADDVSKGKNWLVKRFQQFREEVPPHHHSQIGRKRIMRRKKKHQHQNQPCVHLHHAIEAQIPCAPQFAPIPLHDARRANDQSHRKKPQPSAHTDSFGDHGRNQGHEDHGHRQPVTDKTRVIRSQVVIPRSKSREQQPTSHQHVRPALTRVDKVYAQLCGSQPEQEPQAPDPNKGECDIGNHITKIRDAQPATLVGKIMVALRLSDARRQCRSDDDQHRHGQQEPNSGPASHHQVIPILSRMRVVIIHHFFAPCRSSLNSSTVILPSAFVSAVSKSFERAFSYS